MRTKAITIILSLCVLHVFAEQYERAPLKRTVYRPLEEKPETKIHITPADAEAFWKQNVPSALLESDDGLDEFKRTNAHLFWLPYVNKLVTISGQPYCTCCFYAPIGYSGRGYSDGWTIRLDEYIAIGFPQGSTAYSEGGKNMGTKGPLRPLRPIVQAVGTVEGPHSITNSLKTSFYESARAYFVLEQKHN